MKARHPAAPGRAQWGHAPPPPAPAPPLPGPRPRMTRLDAVVVGAGPNGLSAAVTLARAGLRVQLLEAHTQVGGGLSSAGLTLPGFIHDLGSAIHPLAVASPAFRQWPLHAFGLRWVYPEVPAAQTLPGGRSVLLRRDLDATAEGLGRDGAAWRRLLARRGARCRPRGR